MKKTFLLLLLCFSFGCSYECGSIAAIAVAPIPVPETSEFREGQTSSSDIEFPMPSLVGMISAQMGKNAVAHARFWHERGWSEFTAKMAGIPCELPPHKGGNP